MARTQCLAYTAPSSLAHTRRILICLAVLQESAKRKKSTERPRADLSENAAPYEMSQEARYAPISRETCIVDSKTETWLKFQKLVAEWKKQRGAQSSITDSVVMPAYQEIIGMGERAIPSLIAQLRSEGDQPDQWFWALRAITGENPVKPEEQGNFKKMSKAWITWSEQNAW